MRHIINAVRRSLVLKVFAVSFIAIHLPLIGLLLYLGVGQPSDPLLVLLVALVATLAGCAISFMAIHKFVSPIDRLIAALDLYNEEGVEPFVAVKGSDGVKRLVDKVLELVRSQENSLTSLRRQANTDPLTGLGNRRWLEKAASVEINRALRLGHWVWVVVFDLDHFKEINDRYGHAAGDEVLVAVSEAAQRQVRPGDLIARIGGEEFCIVIVDNSAALGLSAAERIRAAVEEAVVRLDDEKIVVTASFGVHRGDAEVESFADMIRLADEQLYKAKAGGRNLVIGADVAR